MNFSLHAFLGLICASLMGNLAGMFGHHHEAIQDIFTDKRHITGG